MIDVFNEAIKPKAEPPRKPLTKAMIDFTKPILEKWFFEIGFNPNEVERSQLDTLIAWVAEYGISMAHPDQCDRPAKCLMLCGQCGRGKTMLAKLLHKKFVLSFWNADELDKIAVDEENASYFTLRTIYGGESDLVIDDIGAETLRTRYGNAPEFPQMLQRIYDAWKYRGKLIIATTNLGLSAVGIQMFAQRYGERTAERLAEMFLPVYLTGETNFRRYGN